MPCKNFAATGSWIPGGPGPRPARLLSQLVFNTFHNGRLHDWEHGADAELAPSAGPTTGDGRVLP